MEVEGLFGRRLHGLTVMWGAGGAAGCGGSGGVAPLVLLAVFHLLGPNLHPPRRLPQNLPEPARLPPRRAICRLASGPAGRRRHARRRDGWRVGPLLIPNPLPRFLHSNSNARAFGSVQVSLAIRSVR
eukprot:4271404-Pyramimonas_sp.AAC.1